MKLSTYNQTVERKAFQSASAMMNGNCEWNNFSQNFFVKEFSREREEKATKNCFRVCFSIPTPLQNRGKKSEIFSKTKTLFNIEIVFFSYSFCSFSFVCDYKQWTQKTERIYFKNAFELSKRSLSYELESCLHPKNKSEWEDKSG